MNNGLQVFLAHASEDKDKVRQLRERLSSEGVKPWLDEIDLEPGTVWPVEIPKAIRNCDIFLACLSKNSIQKTGYIQKELRLALVAYSERPAGEIYLIPVKLDECEMPSIQLPELGIDFKHFQYVDLWKDDGYSRLLKAIQKASAKKYGFTRKQIPEPELKPTQWEKLEKAVRDIAATAGFAAMGYYRNALAESSALTITANPSTLADENATVATLQTLYSLDPLASELGYQYRVFAEELDTEEVAEKIKAKLQGNPIFSKIKTSTAQFRDGWEHSMAILIDAIDGTANFDACLPFFSPLLRYFSEAGFRSVLSTTLFIIKCFMVLCEFCQVVYKNQLRMFGALTRGT